MSQLIPHTPVFSYKTNLRDIENLRLSLTECIEAAEIPIIKNVRSRVRILNLACGRSDETGILFDILGGKSTACELLGIDIRAREIAEANTRWNSLPAGNARFIVHDGTKLDQIKAVQEGFDFAFMRHQNFWNGDLTWHKIYDQALHSLKEDGILIITSYFDREHLLAVQAIQTLGAHLIMTWKNPRSRTLEEKYAKSADRHIALFKLTS